MNRKLATITLAGGLTVGFAGMAFGVPAVSAAQTADESSTDAVVSKATRLAETLAPLVADGTITQAQADKVATALEAARPAGGRGGMGGHGRGMSLEVAATAIGVTAEELRTAVQGGQTIAQVAESKGVDVQKVIDAIVADRKAKEAAEVAAGEHTQAEVDAKLADLEARVTTQVNSTAPIAGKGGPGGRGGHGPGGRGQKPADAPATATSTTTGS